MLFSLLSIIYLGKYFFSNYIMNSEICDWMDIEDFHDLPVYKEINTPEFNDKDINDKVIPDNSIESPKSDFTVDMFDILIKSEKERQKLTLEDLTRVVIKFINKSHSKGSFLNSIELLRFLVYKIGLEEKKIKRRMYDVLQVLSGCGILKKINRKMFFVCV